MAEADKVQAIEMAPALAVEKMIESGLTPQMVVQYKTVDQLAGIAQASAQMFEHIHLGQVTVYGAGNFMGQMDLKTAIVFVTEAYESGIEKARSLITNEHNEEDY